MVNTFDWVEIRASDMEATASFYESLFGWRVVRREPAGESEYWIFETGGEPRAENLRRGGIGQRPEEEGPGVVIYVLVEDIEAALRKVVDLGGEVVIPKTSQGHAWRACFADPSGNVRGLWEESEGG